MIKTYKISIFGLVQGVGFRPFVYGLAKEFSLTGSVSNNSEGVIIYCNGTLNSVEKFYTKLIHNPPPVSKIQEHHLEETSFKTFNDFSIVPSKKNTQLNLPLTPDFAICDDCKKDIINPENRRFNYPFTTCVNCGPRWAITETFPFEREHTSIDDFPMCKECIEEYTNPSDRRFHSQTNTCKSCGIQLKLIDNKGSKINSTNIFEKTAELLSKGAIIAIKNTSGYLLCCNAEIQEAIEKLRFKKNRPKKPFAVLYPSLKFLKTELEVSLKHEKSLTSTERPISIINSKKYNGKIAIDSIAPGLNQLGVMLPYSGLLQLLANELNFPIIATSGNIHGSPILNKNSEAFSELKSVADYFLQHNLKISHPQDDSVSKFSSKFEQEVLFRRSRGYAPNFLDVTVNSSEKIMAMGAHLKSSVSFFPNKHVYISQYLGNLDNFNVYNRYINTAYNFTAIFEQQPEVIIVDKHPLYQSTQFGKELAIKTNSKLVRVQHHEAHFTAILGEHNLFQKKVLGVVFDGTGFGNENEIWGGEFFNYEQNALKRIHHLENFDWILGDKMSKEPRVSLFSLASDEMSNVLSDKFSEHELKSYQYLKEQNALKTSSVGRLFDALASLLNITDKNTYEGEAAILLENYIRDYDLNKCTYYLPNSSNYLSATEIISRCYFDLMTGIDKAQIITNFLYTLANFIIEFGKQKNFEHIALSGGVFQNTTLVDMLIELAPNEIKLYFHKNLSPNDENISFGQLMHYLNIHN